MTCSSDTVNGNNSPASVTASGNVYWTTFSGGASQKWQVKTVASRKTLGAMASQFLSEYFYSARNASWPGYIGECTWYCNGRAYEKGKTSKGLVATGHAESWLDTAQVGRVVRGKSTPVSNSIAVFTYGSYGHVVYVESANSSNVTYSEANGTSKNSDGTTRTLSNGQIEVPPVSTDGKSITVTASAFKQLLGGTYAGYIDLN